MTGKSRAGKMSMRVRRTARIDESAMAATMTMIVIGRLRARRTSHMGYGPPCVLSWRNCKKGCKSPCEAATEAKFCQTARRARASRSEEHTSELQSLAYLV